LRRDMIKNRTHIRVIPEISTCCIPKGITLYSL
jgi:hypothetical protein